MGGKLDSTMNVSNESGYCITMCVCVLSGFVHVEGCASGVRTFCERCDTALLSMCEKCTVLSLTCWKDEERKAWWKGKNEV